MLFKLSAKIKSHQQGMSCVVESGSFSNKGSVICLLVRKVALIVLT